MSVQIDDQMPDHPKVVAAGGDAAWLLVCALCYSAKHSTDGHIPDGLIPRLSDRRQPRKLWNRLHTERLVHTADETCDSPDCPATIAVERAREDEWVIHDYWRWNESSEQASKRRAETAERVRKYREKKKHSSNGERNALRNGDETPPTSTPTSTTDLQSPSVFQDVIEAAVDRLVEAFGTRADQDSHRAALADDVETNHGDEIRQAIRMYPQMSARFHAKQLDLGGNVA